GSDRSEDGGGDVAGRPDQRSVVAVRRLCLARQVFDRLVRLERRLRDDAPRNAYRVGGDAAVLVGGEIIRLDDRRVGRIVRAQAHMAAAGRLQIAHACGGCRGGGQRIAALVERQRLEVERAVGGVP